MAVMTSALIRLYPRAWRERYGAEMQDLLARQPASLRAMTDLLAGAIDARLNPQNLVVANLGIVNPAHKGNTMIRVLSCAPAGVSVADQFRSAAWMIGTSLVMVTLSIMLKSKFGPSSFSEGLLYAGFPAALMLSSQSIYLRCYSPAARRIISIGGAVGMVLFMWAVTAISYRI